MAFAGKGLWRALLAVPPIALGVAVLLWAAGERNPPTRVERGEVARSVRVVEVQPVDFVPAVAGYGEARPARVWSAVSQVSGRIVSLHPRLRNGEVIAAGELLLAVDPVDYELRVAEIRAELAELGVSEDNTRALLAIEARNLDVAEREMARVARLAGQGTSAQSDVDAAERAMLTSRAARQNMLNALALVPSQRRLLEVRLNQAERDLADTRVEAPFTMRIAQRAVERDQYVSVGQTLFEGDSIDRVEITAQVAMASLRRLFVGRDVPNADVEAMLGNLPQFARLSARVRLDLGDRTAAWDATFLRFSDGLDPATRTVGVVVAVDQPYKQAIPGVRPPLTKGMYVQTILSAQPVSGTITLPRSAVRSGRVWTVDADNRLSARAIEVSFNQGEVAVIGRGVDAGDRVVVSHLVPAVEGMALLPERDDAAEAALRTSGAAL